MAAVQHSAVELPSIFSQCFQMARCTPAGSFHPPLETFLSKASLRFTIRRRHNDIAQDARNVIPVNSTLSVGVVLLLLTASDVIFSRKRTLSVLSLMNPGDQIQPDNHQACSYRPGNQSARMLLPFAGFIQPCRKVSCYCIKENYYR